MTHPAADPLPNTAEVVAEAVLGTAGVVGLHGGAFGEVATYLPRRRIDGIRLTDTYCAIHIVARIPADLPAVAELVRARVAPMVGVPVQVTVEDVRTGDNEGTRS